MKALTICEPYASLIMLGRKRVENRTWSTPYRGNLYIHAGKSRSWLDLDDAKKIDRVYKLPVSRMSFGAVIAIAKLIDCVHIDSVRHPDVAKQYPWLAEHEHTEGPWCWVFAEGVLPIGPWPWKGQLGLFEIDEVALGRVANQQLGIPKP